MAEPADVFVPAAAAAAVVEARLAAGWTLLTVRGMRVRRGDATPDPALTVDAGPEGATDPAEVLTALRSWPSDPELFADVRFAPR